jgi:predicted NAD-dependent protein-ADP-ribosyltransferase YbiA (DUF1768 family)
MTIKIEFGKNVKSNSFVWMSPMFECSLTYKAEKYNSVQSLFQCICVEKSELSDLLKEEIIERIKRQKTAREARSVWLNICHIELPDFPIEKQFEIMKFCIDLKLEQYPELKNKLIFTGHEEIIDLSIINKFWCKISFRDELVGENNNGKILMEIRSELLKNEKYFIDSKNNLISLTFLNDQQISVDSNNLIPEKVNVSKAFTTRLLGSDNFREFFYKKLMLNKEMKEFIKTDNVELTEVIFKNFESLLNKTMKTWLNNYIKKFNDVME